MEGLLGRTGGGLLGRTPELNPFRERGRLGFIVDRKLQNEREMKRYGEITRRLFVNSIEFGQIY